MGNLGQKSLRSGRDASLALLIASIIADASPPEAPLASSIWAQMNRNSKEVSQNPATILLRRISVTMVQLHNGYVNVVCVCELLETYSYFFSAVTYV